MIHPMVSDCIYCGGERHVHDWRTWIKAYRKYQHNIGFKLSCDEVLSICRDLRDGFWSPVRKMTVHTEDCPCVHYIEKES